MSQPPHLLIADDEPSVRALLQILFQQQGYRVSAARDGRDAVEKARALRPDVIILDIQMPIMTGLEVIAVLRGDAQFRTLPIIALTAHIRDYLPSTVGTAGFTHVLTKPFDMPELLEVIAAAVREAPLSR